MKTLLYVLLIGSCSSCLSLEAVQQYASESAESNSSFNEVELSFRALCQRKRQWRDVRQSRMLRTYQDSCRLHRQADSALLTMHTAVQEYLLALVAVSGGERVYYSLAPAKDALNDSGIIAIEAATADAYQNLLEVLVTASTEAYRRRQVQQLVRQANAPLTALIEHLTGALNGSLREAIRQQQEMHYLNTREWVDSAQTFMEKRIFLEQFMEQIRYYEQQDQLLDNYAAMLGTIKEGHQQLYDRREKLHRKETATTMVYYLKELRRLQASFKKDASEAE